MLHRLALILTALLLLPTTASAQKGIRTTAAADFDFEAVETYSWKSRPEREKTAIEDGSPLDEAIRRGSDQMLQKAGLRRVSSGGDLELTYDGVIVDSFIAPDRFEAVDLDSPGAVAGPTGQTSQVGTLVISVYEPAREEPVWSGTGRQNLGAGVTMVDSARLRRKAEALAKKIAKKFPR